MVQYKQFCLTDYQNNLIVTDKYVGNLYEIKGKNVFYLPRGEKAKSFASVQKLINWFIANNLQKDNTVVAVGGGSIGDAVGFACSIYMRGVKLLHVPTTLIAQVDSSIGGKTALDVNGIKNVVGTFYQADTLIDCNFLATLDSTQLESGKGEIIKYCILQQSIANLYQNGTLQQVIQACVNYKQDVCNADFCDNDKRHVLNLGHTIGHAMELAYKLPHGVAVANGLYYEILLANKLGKCTDKFFETWQSVILGNYKLQPLTNKVLQQVIFDKKNKDGKIAFVSPSTLETYFITYKELQQTLLND